MRIRHNLLPPPFSFIRLPATWHLLMMMAEAPLADLVYTRCRARHMPLARLRPPIASPLSLRQPTRELRAQEEADFRAALDGSHDAAMRAYAAISVSTAASLRDMRERGFDLLEGAAGRCWAKDFTLPPARPPASPGAVQFI